MIVELPADGCTKGAAPAVRAKMSAARAAFIKACPDPSSNRFLKLRGTATITGVGFFDVKHGQRGVAPNGIELHPVLGFSVTACTTAG